MMKYLFCKNKCKFNYNNIQYEITNRQLKCRINKINHFNKYGKTRKKSQFNREI